MTSLLTEVSAVWVEPLLLWHASSPLRGDGVRRAMRGTCIKTWEITAPTYCYRNCKKSENTGLTPFYLPDCCVGGSTDSKNLTLQPSAELVLLKGNQFKFCKEMALPLGRQWLPARCVESCSHQRNEADLCAQQQVWLVARIRLDPKRVHSQQGSVCQPNGNYFK